jgi:hypothetical protein
LVFVGRRAAPLDYERTKDAFYAALVNAGLDHLREQEEPVTLHDLRHTFGTRMAAGVPVRSLQEWVGHADLKTTQRYMHYAPRADEAARLSAFIAAQMERTSSRWKPRQRRTRLVRQPGRREARAAGLFCVPNQRLRPTLRTTQRN